MTRETKEEIKRTILFAILVASLGVVVLGASYLLE